MPKSKSDNHEKTIQEAVEQYQAGTYSPMRSAAPAYGLPYETLRNRLRGAQAYTRSRQLLVVGEEKAIVPSRLPWITGSLTRVIDG